MKNQYNKIPLPWSSIDDGRAKQTKVYWHMMRAWNGHDNASEYSVADIIDDINVVLRNTDPNTKLSQMTTNLQNDVIMYGTKSKKGKVVRLHPHLPPTPPATTIVL